MNLQAKSTMDNFVNELQQLGFTLVITNICPCSNRDYNAFVQVNSIDTEWNRTHIAKDLEWERRSGCKECIDVMTNNLDCSGLVFNSRMFHNDIDISQAYFDDWVHPLDPNVVLEEPED